MEREMLTTNEFRNHVYERGIDIYREWEFKAGGKVLIRTPVYLRNNTVYAVDPLPTLEIELTRKVVKKGVGWYMGSVPVGLYNITRADIVGCSLIVTPRNQIVFSID